VRKFAFLLVVVSDLTSGQYYFGKNKVHLKLDWARHLSQTDDKGIKFNFGLGADF
jgi:hypothetical protein